MKLFKYLFIVSIIFFLSACKKNTEDPPTIAQLLSRGSWKTIEETCNRGNTGWYDFWATVPDCFKDNTISYNSDLSAVLDYGSFKCYPSEPQTSLGSWILYSSGNKYSVTINGIFTEYDILELSDQVLKIYFKVTNGNTIDEYKATMTH